MSELHKFLFEGLPVRGSLVQVDEAWAEVLRRRAASATGAWPQPVQAMLGDMVAAACLMQAAIKFDGALSLQIMGDGPVQLAVVEVLPDLALRVTAKVGGTVSAEATLTDLVNVNGAGKCALMLNPRLNPGNPGQGQQPYQGVVPLTGASGEALATLSEALAHYMRQSEQLDTTLVLASNAQRCAGLLVQRMPMQGQDNLAASSVGHDDTLAQAALEDYERISLLAASLKPHELLALDAQTVLHRLFWEEKLLQFERQDSDAVPHFACSCSRERVRQMIVGLGEAEAHSLVAERGSVEVGCEFCGNQYRFDPVDVAAIFHENGGFMPPAHGVQ